MMRCKANVPFLLLILLHYAKSGSADELMPMSGSGSGGSGQVDLPMPTCTSSSLIISVNIFDTIADKLQQLECTVEGIGYTVVYKSLMFDIRLSDTDYSVVFGDYFDYSDDKVQELSLEVCTYDVITETESCNEELINVSATITRYTNRLLPFNVSFIDASITNADDRAVGVFLSNPIPFWGSYYNSVYLSTNGVLSFGQSFTQYWPVTFPYGWGNVPILAPYWNDMDFRNNLPDSGVYYATYVSSGTKRDKAFLQEVSDRLASYTDDDIVSFKPKWMLVATWYKATPYYGRYNTEETVTFQVLLLSDLVDTYSVFLYEEGGINWSRNSRHIVIGYDAKNYVDYLNVEEVNSKNFFQIDTLIGNTGNEGIWLFKLTDSDSDLNPEQECYKWAQQEDNLFKDYFEGLPSCPCTHSQARRDWRFWFGWRWGLSSGINCATLIWSRRQSTVECCYDDDTGALVVGGISGGSYKLYHPLVSNRDYVIEDKQPYEYCCQLSKLCPIFYSHRPSDDCSGYDPSEISFAWGDPHLQTIDGLTYTFNGYGEYVLLKSEDNSLTVQIRLSLFDSSSTDFNATVISAVVVVHGIAQPVQIEEGDDDGSIAIYVNGTHINLTAEDDSNIIVTETTVYDSFNEFVMSEQNFSTTHYVSLRYDDDDLIISTSSGASISVSSSMSILNLAVEVNEAFINNTMGLLGYFNGDMTDDYYRPDGSTLSINSTESEIFTYGKLWHIDEDMSHFTYFDDTDYSTYNDVWDTHTPTFLDEIYSNILSDVETVCEGDLQCIFDYGVSNNASFATATHTTTIDNQETQDILANSAPVIIGDMVVYVTSGEIFQGIYSVSDEDDHNITSFELKNALSDNIKLEVDDDGLEAVLVWDSPGSELPQTAIQILANDSMGAVTIRDISIILCACNNGTCINTTTPLFNANGHYRQECECPEFFTGDLCEIDDRRCTDASCPVTSLCVVNSSVPAGFTCSDCQDGYELAYDEKCTDMDECTTSDPEYMNDCMHICNNIEGSYECLCFDGYVLAEDGRNCTDIDECYEGSDDCEMNQMCNNTEGSFTCECVSPYILSIVGSCTVDPCSGCDGSICAKVDSSQGICICDVPGTYCVGVCEGSLTTLMQGSQSCDECVNDTCGYRCLRDCNCVHGECVSSNCSCVCEAGFEGNRCEIEINDFAPEFDEDTINELTLSWNLPKDAVLAQFNATDNDTGAPGEVVYSLYHGYQLPLNVSSGEDVFGINNETGVLVLIGDLNTTFGMYNRFVLTVLATDLGGKPQSSEIIVSIRLEDTLAPIPRFDEDFYEIKISENIPSNSMVLNFTCTEPVGATGTSNLTTQLMVSNDSLLFSLNGEYDNLMLVLLENIDYEALSDTTIPHYTLEVSCYNQYQITASATIEIEIENEDDNYFEFDNSTYNVVVLENVPRYHEVITVTAFDPDIPDGYITYSTIHPTTFSIYPDNGTVYVTQPHVDRETQDNYTLNIQATLHSSGEIALSTIEITIADINEKAPLFTNELYISENLTTANTIGDVALVVTAVDDDFENNGSIVYSIEDNLLFAINNRTGVIYIVNDNAVLHYGSHLFKVYASDEGTPSLNSSAMVDIYVAPIPDRIVFRNFSSQINISEDRLRGYEIDTILGEVLDENNGVINDAETVGDVEYTLLERNNSNHFHIGRSSGKLILLNSLDFEMQRSYELNITASIPNYAEASIQYSAITEVNVMDVNDNAPVFVSSFYSRIVEEFTDIGTSVVTVHADDADTGLNANITYRLTDDTVPFSIDSVTGVVEVSEQLNTPLDYRFYVLAEDSGTQPKSSEAVIFVSVVRSASIVPEFDRHVYKFYVSENVASETNIGTVNVLDPQNNSSINEYTHLKYRLRAPDLDMMMDVNDMFHIDPYSGDFHVLAPLDVEQQSFYAVYVEVYNSTDDMHVFDNATIEIYVEDVNDHAPRFDQSLYTEVITTAQEQYSILFNVSAYDGDDGSLNSQIVYSLPDIIGFGINPTTGEISIVNSSLAVGEYHMTATATDMGDPTLSGTALVFIAVIPAGPQSILFEENEYIFEIREDALPGASVGTIVALDQNRTSFDSADELRYYFSNTSVIEFVDLIINEYTGEVKVSSLLDREEKSRYKLVVFAQHEGNNQTGEVSMTVNVLDINDNSPVFDKDVYAIVIYTTHGNTTVVIQVTAEDRDADLNGMVHYSFSEGSNEDSLFRITTDTGDIYLLNEHIPAGDYRLVITASDSDPTNPQISTAVVFICVIHQQPAGPLQIATTQFSINENSAIGTVVGTIELEAGGMTIVPDHFEGNIAFIIVGEHPFVINSNNGTLKTVGQLDREDQSHYDLQIEVDFTEYDNIFTNAIVTIIVGDSNDNYPIFYPLVYSAIIHDAYTDNQSIPVDDILVTDRDAGTNAELQFTVDEETPFGIRVIRNLEGELLGELIVRNASLLEPVSYLFNVIASDMGDSSLSSSAAVYIDVMYAIPDIISFSQTHYMFNHTENSVMRTLVGTVRVEQETPALDGLVYLISGGSGVNKFGIEQHTGEISNHFSLDREVDDKFMLNVTAQFPHHSPTLTAHTFVIITILDDNDNIPIFDQSSYYTAVYTDDIDINVPLINVSASDDDIGLNSIVTYNISSSNDHFTIDENGSIFAVTTSLEVMTHTLTVEAIDMGDAPQTGITIVIIDIRQAIPEFIAFSQSQYYFNISEYSISGTVVGMVELAPQLAPDFVQFRTFSSESDDFVVVTQSGTVQSRRQFDYESNENTIVFEVTCILDLPYETPRVILVTTASITVIILDENDNFPQFTAFPTALEHPENVAEEELIADIDATDADYGINAQLVYTIVNDVLVRIDSETGELFIQPGLDREQQAIHTISVQVEDMGTPSHSSQSEITLTLLDINDNIPILTTTQFSVEERFTGTVFQLEYSDLDEGNYGRATFSLVGESDSRFSVDSLSGQVSLSAELDYETDQVVILHVRLADNPDDPSDNSNIHEYTVTVNVIDRPDTVPEFDANLDYSLAIDPGITSGDILINVHATDADIGDVITYSIASSNADFVDINTATGDLYFTETATLAPGSDYEIIVVATDDSAYELSSSVTVTIRIDARSLTFEQDAYTSSVSEAAPTGDSIQRIRIQELARSPDYEYEFTYEVLVPPDIEDPFDKKTFPYRIDILVDDELDRETVSTYVLEITATRVNLNESGDTETRKVNITITVTDVNDNPPDISPPDSMYEVMEDVVTDTEVAQVIASDADIGVSSELEYSIVSPVMSPFTIDDNGLITVRESLDYESQTSYELIVVVNDRGDPSLTSTAQYSIQIINVNDRAPEFAALAYFGELYADAAANSPVFHVLLEVTDLDGDRDFTFSIEPDPTDTAATAYALSVSNVPPYTIIANSIPPNAESGLRKFSIEVSDGIHKTSTILYLGVFAQEHLLPMTISAQQSKEEFETILVNFLSIMSEEFTKVLGQPASYYYESLTSSSTDTTVLIMNVYGWYGGYGTRYDDGKEDTEEFSNSVSYITYDDIADAINTVAERLAASTGIDLSIGEVPSSTSETTQPAADNTLLVGIVAGSTVAALIIVLLIVIFIVLGRRKKAKPEKDPYNDLSYSGRRRRGKRPDTIPLTPKAGGSSDLAYETMYDDDDMMNRPQTMPWFDPNYLASNDYEGYDGDVEQSSLPKGGGGGLRATVDGDAKRNRRHSSDESAGGGSVTEIDPSRYLGSYKHSTPMQPGQKMGEYDNMFLNQNARDADKPRRPSLHNITTSPSRGQQRTTT